MNPDEDLLNYYVPATAHRIELFTTCSFSLKLPRNGSDNVSARLNYISVSSLIPSCWDNIVGKFFGIPTTTCDYINCRYKYLYF